MIDITKLSEKKEDWAEKKRRGYINFIIQKLKISSG